MPEELRSQIQGMMANEQYDDVRAAIQKYTSNPANKLQSSQAAQAGDTLNALLNIPEAMSNSTGTRIDDNKVRSYIESGNLPMMNRAINAMSQNLREHGMDPQKALGIYDVNTLPAVQGERMPSTDVQREEPAIEGTVEDTVITPPYNGKPAYNENQLEAPAIESDHLNSKDFLAGLSPVERGFMEYLDNVFDNTGVAFVDIMQHLNSQRNSLLGKAIEMFKNGYAVDSVVFSRMNDTQRSALVNYRRMLDVYGNSLTNADRDVIDEFTRLDNIINEYLAPMAHNYLINNNVLNYRGIDNAIKGLEGIAAKAREYEQIKVSEGYREGRATGNKVVPREDEEAISGSATAWGNVLHQTQKRGLPA